MLHKLASLWLVLLLALALGACGSDDEESDAGASKAEQAFLEGMIPHHESAVEMAEQALEEAEHPELKRLAEAIVEAQEAEITEMEQIHERMTGDEVMPDPAAHEDLGLSQEEAGMHEGGAMMLDAEEDFDKEFIDAMIPHHQGAIRMAHILLADTDDAELERLGSAIIAAQSKEIRDMNSWRKRWYGRRSPAGGIPGVDDLPPTEDPEEHVTH